MFLFVQKVNACLLLVSTTGYIIVIMIIRIVDTFPSGQQVKTKLCKLERGLASCEEL